MRRLSRCWSLETGGDTCRVTPRVRLFQASFEPAGSKARGGLIRMGISRSLCPWPLVRLSGEVDGWHVGRSLVADKSEKHPQSGGLSRVPQDLSPQQASLCLSTVSKNYLNESMPVAQE